MGSRARLQVLLGLALLLTPGCAVYHMEKWDGDSGAKLNVTTYRKMETISIYYNREDGEFRAIAGNIESAISAETAAKLMEAGAKALSPLP